MAQPATTKAKPGAAPAAAPPSPPPPVSDFDARQGSHGFGAFVARQYRKFVGQRPDHSEEGLIAAIRAGIQFVSKKDWNTADDMLEELEHQIRTSLRAASGIYCEYVARDRETKQPRILVVTDWGLREAVEGQISFQLHYKPDRTTPAMKEHRNG